jgi:membrane-bound serine protease (ClpP class)
VVAEPNIAYLLFIVGVIGVIAELYSPGLVVPGLVGALALILAMLAFGDLPLWWGGLALLLVGVALMLAELHVEGFGVLGIAGIAAFLFGSLFLYSPPGADGLAVSPWLLALMAATLGTFVLGVMRAVLRSRRTAVTTGSQALRGRTGTALSDLTPSGTVEVDRESWSARAVEGPIGRGEPIVVIDVKGVVLEVARQTPADRQESGGAD